MNDANFSKLPKKVWDKVAFNLVAYAVAHIGRMNMLVLPEMVAREQPEQLREYFMERVRYYLQVSTPLTNANDPRYREMAEANKK